MVIFMPKPKWKKLCDEILKNKKTSFCIFALFIECIYDKKKIVLTF